MYFSSSFLREESKLIISTSTIRVHLRSFFIIRPVTLLSQDCTLVFKCFYYRQARYHFFISAPTLSQIILYFSRHSSSSIKKIHSFCLSSIIFYKCTCLWKNYMLWLNFIFITIHSFLKRRNLAKY